MICASRLTLTGPIAGLGNNPANASESPTPISIRIRQPTVVNPAEDTLDESHGGYSTDCLDVEGYSPHDGNQPSDHISSIYAGYLPESQYSHHPPPEYFLHSTPGQNDTEENYLPPRPSSPALSVRPPSVADSVVSRVHRASRPTTRGRRSSPMSNAPRRRAVSPSPAPTCRNVSEAPPDISVPELPLPKSRTSGEPIRHGHASNVVTLFESPASPPPKSGLRPMIGIDRYEKHRMVTVENVMKSHVCPPLTIQFMRWVFGSGFGK